MATITVDDILAKTGGSYNEMAHFDIVADTGAAGAHTLELVDVTANASNFGFALDTIQVHDWFV